MSITMSVSRFLYISLGHYAILQPTDHPLVMLLHFWEFKHYFRVQNLKTTQRGMIKKFLFSFMVSTSRITQVLSKQLEIWREKNQQHINLCKELTSFLL